MTSLVFQAGPNASQRYRLQDGEYIIGRRSDCQVFVPDMRVSRQHARIHRVTDRWMIEDLGSNNGTYVNGSRIQHHELRDQDLIRIAGNLILVEVDTRSLGPEQDAGVTIIDLANPRIYRGPADGGEQIPRNKRQTDPDLIGRIKLQERKLAALTAITLAAGKAREPHDFLEPLSQQLLELFPTAIAVGILDLDANGELVVSMQQHRDTQQPLEVAGSIVRYALVGNEEILVSEATSEPPTGTLPPVPRVPQGSEMASPITAHERRFGALYVQAEEDSLTQPDLDLLASIGAQAGLAIASAEMRSELRTRQRLERDLMLARQIQRSLLPANPPKVVGLEFAVHYEPAYQIGGDFYDFIWHDDSHLAIVIGDVAGKAISAALYMARLSSELRSRAAIARTPARLLRKVNQEMLALGDDGMFATLAYSIYDLETRTLVFTNAGHVVPILRRDQRVYPLHAERAHVPALGVIPQVEVGEARVQLHSGDLIVFTTDGVHEARNARGQEYGLKRLSRRIRTARGRPVDIVTAILADIDDHVGTDIDQTDDITIAVMSVGDKRARRRTDTLPGLNPEDIFDGPTQTGRDKKN